MVASQIKSKLLLTVNSTSFDDSNNVTLNSANDSGTGVRNEGQYLGLTDMSQR